MIDEEEHSRYMETWHRVTELQKTDEYRYAGAKWLWKKIRTEERGEKVSDEWSEGYYAGYYDRAYQERDGE